MTTRYFTLLEVPAEVHGYDSETPLLLLDADDGDAIIGFIDEIYEEDQSHPDDLTEKQIVEWAGYTLGVLTEDLNAYRNRSGGWEVSTDVDLW